MSIAYKEAMELLEAASLGIDDAKEIFADGKVDFRDLTVLLKMSRQMSAFNAGFQGLVLIWPNIGAVTDEEWTALVAKAMELLAKIGLGVQQASSLLAGLSK